ncbi:tetratricopeptide repeat protein [Flavobacterium sp. MAH-1]|uniref:Tetratricopeptide repeat protein n=1 Tax=Flavobacterium agri TaxID=2743471 RepID=A0A7Y9C6B8_9FLAO|nr:tetratricopeptide repeat protein [Flavobacterium agri]NUY81275.1 tetratricopeptide repeat protein [Flavobacterium agri]NYA71299.1 tetratricopeptide repeat protein [Flavobacterium agri]
MTRFLMMLLVCGFVSAQGKKQLDAAEAKMKTGDFKAAISLYSDAIKAEPKNAKYYNKRAFAYSMDTDYDKAYEDYSTSIKLEPDSAILLYDRALFFFTVNALTEAKLDHDVALQKANGDKVLETRLLALNGDIRRNQGDLEGAVKDYKKVLESNPEDGLKFACITNIGAVLGRLNRNDEAISYLEEAVKTYPKVPSVYNNLGFRYLAKNDYAKALQIYDKAISLSPKVAADGTTEVSSKAKLQDNVSASLLYNNRGYAKMKLGDLNGAMSDVNQSISLSADNSYAFRNRALIYNEQNNVEAACQDVKKALELGFTKSYGDELENLKKLICK